MLTCEQTLYAQKEWLLEDPVGMCVQRGSRCRTEGRRLFHTASPNVQEFLLAWSLEGPLTIEDIQLIHRVMMRGSPGIEAGVFRSGAASENRGA
ncbi:hypothetical protein BASA82_000530 [Batrachochytrium salamandrivorans]|nr:hypothetical protein BASA82_000530 [Batrachochytrium salamandrivorans]